MSQNSTCLGSLRGGPILQPGLDVMTIVFIKAMFLIIEKLRHLDDSFATSSCVQRPVPVVHQSR